MVSAGPLNSRVGSGHLSACNCVCLRGSVLHFFKEGLVTGTHKAVIIVVNGLTHGLPLFHDLFALIRAKAMRVDPVRILEESVVSRVSLDILPSTFLPAARNEVHVAYLSSISLSVKIVMMSAWLRGQMRACT